MDFECTIYRTVDFISKRWTLLILLELYKGKNKWKRYSHIKKNLTKITAKILSLRLKELEKEGLIVKKISSESYPIKCEYSLTKRGKAFISIIKDIKKWALKWKFKNDFCNKTDCKECEL